MSDEKPPEQPTPAELGFDLTTKEGRDAHRMYLETQARNRDIKRQLQWEADAKKRDENK